jgi:hypothetical protein
MSYVDDARDGRGWAFRETHGSDPVNGFTLLREADDATEPGFDGHISTPTLWDRRTGRVVSNDFTGIGIDLATQFHEWDNGADTYPEHLRSEIEERPHRPGPATGAPRQSRAARTPPQPAAGHRLRHRRDRVIVALARSRRSHRGVPAAAPTYHQSDTRSGGPRRRCTS